MAEIRTALICLNGHVVNWSKEDRPTFNIRFCKECGANTTDACANCNSPIQGRVVYGNRPGWDNPDKVPAYCHDCGKPYAWTATQIEAARELVQMSTVIKDEEKAEVIDAIIVSSSETPRTPAAAQKLKKYLPSIGEAGKQILINVASETAKRILLGP